MSCGGTAPPTHSLRVRSTSERLVYWSAASRPPSLSVTLNKGKKLAKMQAVKSKIWLASIFRF
jgi:hypothetical protein